jgi:hypothetical protein
MEIKEFLERHPLISLSGIETALGITHGTLRKGKEIPDKFKEEVEGLMKGYGYGESVGSDVVKEVEKIVFRNEPCSKDHCYNCNSKKGNVGELSLPVKVTNEPDIIKKIISGVPKMSAKEMQAKADSKEKERWERINKYNKNNGG